MTIPPIKKARGRPSIELIGGTAQGDIAVGGDLFKLLTRARIIAHALGNAWHFGNGAVFSELPGGSIHTIINPVALGAEPTTLEAQSRDRYGTSSATTQEAGILGNTIAYPTSATSGAPGWGFFSRVTHRDEGDGPRFFAGLYFAGSGVSLTDPSLLTDAGLSPTLLNEPTAHVGIRLFEGETNYQFVYSSGGDAGSPGTVTAVDLGVAAAHSPANEQVFDITIVFLNGVAGFSWEVVDANTGLLVGSGTVTTNTPPSNLPLSFALIGNTGAQTNAIEVGIIYLVAIMEHINALIVAGPSGSVGTGGGTAPDDSPPPTDWPWTELFTETDYTAFYNKYNDFASIGPAPDPATIGDLVTVGSGKIEIKGHSPAIQLSVGISSLTTVAREFWAKGTLDMIGGAYDTAHDPLGLFAYSGSTSLEADMTSDVFGDSALDYWGVLYPSSNHAASATNRALPAGSHTFIMCLSEDDSTHQRLELWIDASPGDTPVATTEVKTAGDGFSTLNFGLFGPTDTARTLRVTGISFIAGTRTSDPFGIL